MDFPKSVPSVGLVNGQFVDENPLTATPGSLIPSTWGNAITNEMLNVITAAGMAPSEVDLTQLLKAIGTLGQSAASSFAIDTGTANTYVCNFTPAITARNEGVPLRFKARVANNGACTFNDGLGAVPLVGGAHAALRGGEIIANGDAWVQWNSSIGSGSYILLFCTGAAEQVAPATQSFHSAQLGQVSGVVGQARNVFSNIAVASATATISADELIVETALGGLRYCLPSFSKTINLAITGAGGMDTGPAPVSSWVAIYAIYNPVTGVSALLAKNATSAIQAEVYSGANMPAGYIASALIAVMPTNASSQFGVAILQDRGVSYFKNIYSGNPGGIWVAVGVSSCVPPNAKTINTNAAISSSGTAGSVSAAICSTANGQGTPGYSVVSSYAPAFASVVNAHYRDIPVFAQQIFIAASGPVASATINSYGYIF